ncbi:TldD/PmbA family protein [archaeon]|nr:MAG: TldD/PmbA family protein [archaeon]HDM23693.1 TldD/PmbA family protein [Candidatus Bathyarchaeota archaeon]
MRELAEHIEEKLDLVEKAISLSTDKGAEYAEARLQLNLSKEMLLQNGQLLPPNITMNFGMGIRVLLNGILGFSSTTNLDEKSISEAVNSACKSAMVSSALTSEKIKFGKERSHRDSIVIFGSRPFDDIDDSEKINFMSEIDKTILSSASKEIKVVNRMVEYTEHWVFKAVGNSDGSLIKTYLTRAELRSFSAFNYNGYLEQDLFQRGITGGWNDLEEINFIEKLHDRTSSLCKVIMHGKSPPSGSIDVVMGGEVVGIAVHESCGHPYEADRILGREAAQAGESFMRREYLGERISCEEVNVIDDPTFEKSFGFYLYDDECVKARPRYLIKNGIVNEFLHNRHTANVFDTESNAAARAALFSREPIIRMSTTFIAPGEHTLDELLENVRRGILIETFGEWNIDDRRFNMRIVGREAYMIRNGKIVHPVKRPVIEVTSLAFYKSIDAVGKNLVFMSGHCGKGDPAQIVPVWFGGPYIRLRRVRLGGV